MRLRLPRGVCGGYVNRHSAVRVPVVAVQRARAHVEPRIGNDASTEAVVDVAPGIHLDVQAGDCAAAALTSA